VIPAERVTLAEALIPSERVTPSERVVSAIMLALADWVAQGRVIVGRIGNPSYGEFASTGRLRCLVVDRGSSMTALRSNPPTGGTKFVRLLRGKGMRVVPTQECAFECQGQRSRRQETQIGRDPRGRRREPGVMKIWSCMALGFIRFPLMKASSVRRGSQTPPECLTDGLPRSS